MEYPFTEYMKLAGIKDYPHTHALMGASIKQMGGVFPKPGQNLTAGRFADLAKTYAGKPSSDHLGFMKNLPVGLKGATPPPGGIPKATETEGLLGRWNKGGTLTPAQVGERAMGALGRGISRA